MHIPPPIQTPPLSNKRIMTKMEMLIDWIGDLPKLNLIYKGSRDGFTAAKFHS